MTGQMTERTAAQTPGPATRPTTPPTTPPTTGRTSGPPSGWVAPVVAAVAAVAWAPFITAPLSPDEGGFLLVASQWRPGHSLYGRYWVDRPPLLISIFDVASDIGGAVALRLIGVAAVLASVFLADRLTRHAAGRTSVPPVVVAGVFLTTPLFGTGMVNGELLAVPIVLVGILALVRSWTLTGHRSTGWAVLAGCAGAAAPLVKQNVVDVLVVAAVLVVQGLRSSRWRRSARLALGLGVGAAVTSGLCLVLAEVRGTEPTMLWDALVTFRGQADTVIRSSSTSSTTLRFGQLVGAALLSGAPLVIAVLALRLRRLPSEPGPPDLRPAGVVLLLWEVIAIGAGGSYWLHYLIGLVPGLVVLAVAAAQRPPRLRRWTAGVLAFACLSAAVATVTAAVNVPMYFADASVAAYLRSHGSAKDTVVVGFGHPDIVWDSGLRSPYALLWSLAVRVRDPDLDHLRHVLSGPHAPTWVVVSGSSLATWGVDATSAQAVLEQRYRPAATFGDYVVWRLVRHTALVR
jgi:hypothetical protein